MPCATQTPAHGAGHNGRPVSGGAAILFCDVDHIKEINNGPGHAAGDRLLAAIGRALTRTARDHDLAGQFGDDEFIHAARPAPEPPPRPDASCGQHARQSRSAAW